MFGSHCSISAEDPDELIGVEEELRATPIDRIILIVSVQNPQVLSWKQRNGLEKWWEDQELQDLGQNRSFFYFIAD